MTLHQYSRREFLSRAAAASLAVSSPAGGHAIAAGLDHLAELSATAAIAAIRHGEITAEIYARALLDRAGRLQNLNAFRTLVPDKVLEAARAADKLRASGARLGALHGLPVPVKDSVNTAGYPTSNGTAALRDFRPDADARVLAPLLAAGAIVMGKTNLHELSLGWTSNNSAFGAVHNPYDSARVPGGSSGGSAVAVAARMAPLAIAEDTLGSIRIPSTMCGIYGLRPTYGRYSNVGVMALTDNKFDQVGPLARTVEDIALFDAVITGEKSPLERVELNGVRIGVADFFFSDVDAEVVRVTNDVLDRLRDAGVTIVHADLPDAAKGAPAAALTIIASEVRPSIEAFLKAQRTGLSLEALVTQVGPDLKPLFAAAPPPRDVYDAMVAERTKISDAIKAHFAEHRIEALAFPPAMIPAHEIGENGSVTVRGQLVSGTTTMGRNVSPGSCASLASLVVPAGLTRAGLPVGLEFDALPGTDRRLIALGLAVERALGSIPAPQLG